MSFSDIFSQIFEIASKTLKVGDHVEFAEKVRGTNYNFSKKITL